MGLFDMNDIVYVIIFIVVIILLWLLLKKSINIIPKIILFPVFKLLELIESKYPYKENRIRKNGNLDYNENNGSHFIVNKYYKWQKKKLKILSQIYRVGEKVVIENNEYTIVRVIRLSVKGKIFRESILNEEQRVFYEWMK